MDTLPGDLLLDLALHLPLQAVLALRRTCRSLAAATRLRSLWALLFRMHVLEQRIPFPAPADTPLADLSADALESLTRRALALRQNWTSPEPVPRRQRTWNVPEPGARIIFLQFLPARSNRWLISVCMTARPRTYLLQCWDVAADPPTCVAELKHADGPYGGVVLNSDPDSTAVLALQSAQTETLSIDFDATDPESAFETEAVIDGIRELHLLSGSTLVTRDVDDGALCLWDLADLDQEKLRLLNPSFVQPDERTQAIHLAHDYALVVRVQSVEIYSTTPRPSILPVRGAPIAYPLAQFKFQWRTDAVVLCEEHAFVDPPDDTPRPRPIHLLVRFGSIYPWPVNVLHHYVLRPNPTYPSGPRPHGSTPSSPSSPSSSGHRSPATTESNLPYDPRPRLSDTVSSPVRLFGQSAMALGRYGTALWLDNHAPEWRSGPSEHGQRLVGRMLAGGGDGALAAVGKGAITSAGGGKPASEPVSGSTSEWSGPSMVFGVRDDDAWTRVALDEEAGCIALGHTDGAITLIEF